MPLSSRYLFFDTETSDMIKFKLPNSHISQPWVVQLAAVVTDSTGVPLNTFSSILHSSGLPIAKGAQDVHNISVETADLVGIQPGAALGMFFNLCDSATHLVAHNIPFDLRMIAIMARRVSHPDAHADFTRFKESLPQICTMKSSTALCQLPYPSGRKGNKWPKLEELYFFLFEEPMPDAHDALADVNATIKCFFELRLRGVL